jgi:hypothetical protein
MEPSPSVQAQRGVAYSAAGTAQPGATGPHAIGVPRSTSALPAGAAAGAAALKTLGLLKIGEADDTPR